MRGVALALALALPAGAGAQVVLGGRAEPGALVLGRACLDVDGDGRCGPAEPGVAGARILAASGRVAVADGEGRFHLRDVPARLLARDRVAYGAERLVVEGLDAAVTLVVAPHGAAQVDLAAPAGAFPLLAPLALAPEGGRAPRSRGDRLVWSTGLRVAPGHRLEVDGATVEPGPDGVAVVELALAPGDNAFLLVAGGPDGGGAAWRLPVHLAPRRDGGALVLPGAPEPLVVYASRPAAGGGVLVTGRAAAAAALAVDGLAPVRDAEGRFALYLPPGAEPVMALAPAEGAMPVRLPLAAADAGGLSAVAGVLDLELSLLGPGGPLLTARGAGAARGRLGPLDLELGVDLDDRDGLAELLRPRDALSAEQAEDPARTFLAVGDRGAAGDRNPGAGRLWARLSGPGLDATVGSGRARLGGAAELGRYERALFGASVAAAAEVGPVALEATGFGASARPDAQGNTPPVARHDVLAPTGGAVYWLSRGEVVPGSEAVRVEWRDPFTGRLVEVRPLVRGEDYALSTSDGRLTLAAPLGRASPRGPRAAAALVTGEPFEAAEVALVVDYLHAGAAGREEDLGGGSVRVGAGPVSIGAAAATERRAGEAWTLGAVQGEVALPGLSVRAEAARSEGALFAAGGFTTSLDGGLARGAAPASAGAAGALHLEARAEAGPAHVEGWWRVREPGYSDGRFQEPLRAAERGAEIGAEVGPVSATLLVAEREGALPGDPTGATPLASRRALARVTASHGAVTVHAEALDQHHEAPAAGDATSAGVRAEVAVAPGLRIDAAHHQALRVEGAAEDPTFTSAGVALEAGRGGALAVRGGWGPELGPRVVVSGERRVADEAIYGTWSADPGAPSTFRSAGSSLGASRAAGAVEVFTEEQLLRDAFGLRAARVVGARVAPARGLVVSLSGEHGERLRPGAEPVPRTGGAAAVGLARETWRVAARGEAREEGDDPSWAAAVSGEWDVARPLTLSARAGYAEARAASARALALEAAVGAALRTDRGALLGSVARVAEGRPGEARRDGVLTRLAGTLPRGRLTLGLGAGVAWWRVAGGRDERVAGSARVQVGVAGPLDAAAEYARRAPLAGRLGALDAARGELGLRAGRARIAMGYTLVGFGGDGLDPAEESHRLHLGLQLAY